MSLFILNIELEKVFHFLSIVGRKNSSPPQNQIRYFYSPLTSIAHRNYVKVYV